jgi:hypothetical protein
MKIRTMAWSIAGLFAAFAARGAEEELQPVVTFGGFIRADYGAGERYPQARGEDRLGVSKAALAATVNYDRIKGVFVVGTERLTDGNPDNDGNVDIKDAFIVIGDDGKPGLSWSVGAQALLFGLKPNGYPGDRSLQPSIEYGGAGAFAVSQQAGPSLIGTYKFAAPLSVRFGAFDLDADNAVGAIPADDGSRLTDNLFVQLRSDDLFATGLYATVGAESLYVGGAVDDTRRIFAAGLGWRQGMFDASVELLRLDSEIVGAPDDEQYLVAELTFLPNEQWTVYADWATASELDADTIRVGAHYELMRHLTFSAEYSKDDFGFSGARNVDSVDVRLTLAY